MVPRILYLHPKAYKRLIRLRKQAERDGAYRVAKRLQAVVLNSDYVLLFMRVYIAIRNYTRLTTDRRHSGRLQQSRARYASSRVRSSGSRPSRSLVLVCDTPQRPR